jgi:hypothetical protein
MKVIWHGCITAMLAGSGSMVDAYWPLVALSSLPALLVGGKAVARLAGHRRPAIDERSVYQLPRMIVHITIALMKCQQAIQMLATKMCFDCAAQ